MILMALAIITLALSCQIYRHPARRYPKPPLAEGPPVSVLLSQGLSELEVSSPDGGIWRSERPGEGELSVGADETTRVSAAGGLSIAGKFFATDTAYFEPYDDIFEFEGRYYRGKLKVQAGGPDEGLRAFELIHLEDYIRGVLPAEVYPDWPMDAIIAQAVAIRTFALNLTLDPDTRSWLTTLDLAYTGADAETERTDEAVRLSRGLTMTWGERLFPAFFHSTCGGHTAPARSVFGDHDIEPLRSVECGHCAHSRHYYWIVSFPLDEVAARAFPGRDITIQNIEKEKMDAGKRPEFVVINGSERIRSSDFRLAMGTTRLKSTRFTPVIYGDKVHFIGSGFGHGVGLCQWGAHGMARDGKNWRQILEHYYPGAAVTSQ